MEDQVEVEDQVEAEGRERLWRERRLFFYTPQAFQKDMESGCCEVRRVVCLVLDEAHKATGKYAYTQVVQRLNDSGAKARVVSFCVGGCAFVFVFDTVILCRFLVHYLSH